MNWYVEADMSKFIAAIINSLNHNVSLENALTPTAKIQKLIRRYNENADGFQYFKTLV